MIMINTQEQGVNVKKEVWLLGLVSLILWVVGGLDVGYLFRFLPCYAIVVSFCFTSPFLCLVLFWMNHDSAQRAQGCPRYQIG